VVAVKTANVSGVFETIYCMSFIMVYREINNNNNKIVITKIKVGICEAD